MRRRWRSSAEAQRRRRREERRPGAEGRARDRLALVGIVAALRRFFDVRPGEGRAVVITFTYIALAVASFLLAKPIRNGLFLSQYGAYKLVYVYVAVPIALSLAMPIYARVGARLGARAVVTGSLVFFSLNVVAFWYFFRFRDVPGLPAIFYVWVNCYGIIAPVQAWTFANMVFDTRQARRLFGLIGSGASLGAIAGGLLARELAGRMGTIDLLLVLAALIALAALVVNVGWRVRRRRDAAEGSSAGRAATTLRGAFALVRGSNYLRLLAAMVFLVAVATQWTQFQFSLAAEIRHGADQDRLTRFFGSFNFWLGAVAFLIQLFLTGPALRRFGVAFTILILPLSLGFGSLLTLAFPALFAVMLTNAFDQSLRFSIDKATFELLYLPLPSNVKTSVKGVIDLLVNRLGDGVGGLLLGLATQGFSFYVFTLPGAGLGLRGLAAVTTVFIAMWLGVALALRRGYVQAITDSIHQYRLDVERASTPVLDLSATTVLAGTLEAGDPDAILYALKAFEMEHRHTAHPAVRALLTHPSPEVRARAVAMLNAAGDASMRPRVEALLKDPDVDVRTEALLFLAYHADVDPLSRIEELGDFADFSIRAGMIAFLSRPGHMQNLDAARVLLGTMVHEDGEEGTRARLEAAALIARLPNEFGAELAHLLEDPDSEVVSAALASLGAIRRRDLAAHAIAHLSSPDLRDAAGQALVEIGAPVLPALASALVDAAEPLDIRRELPAVIATIGTSGAQRILTDNLLQQDVQLRFRIIAALNQLQKLHPDIELDRQAVETVLMAEILGHYRSYQILGTLGGAFETSDPVASALHESMAQDVERIFRLLGLRWPEFDMHSAYVGLQSGTAAVRANALEFLDNILKPQIRSLIVPLLDPSVSRADRIALADRLLGATVDTREQAAAALIASDDPWLRSCGVYAVGMLHLTALGSELDKLASTDDPLLRETVRAAQQRLAGIDPEAVPERPASEEADHAWRPQQEGMGVG
jgi:AAA family ATP:ADP antiporter